MASLTPVAPVAPTRPPDSPLSLLVAGPFSAPTLLAALRAEGFVLQAIHHATNNTGGQRGEGKMLRVSPASRLAPECRAAIRTRRAALLELLHDEEIRADELASVRQRAPHDPRPDLDGTQHDAVWWSVLLALAREECGASYPEGVYTSLRACRCFGAGLARTPGGAVRIVPGAVSPDVWPRVCATWLTPHRAVVRDLLGAVAAAAALRRAELDADAAILADVRGIWPGAKVLTGAAVAALAVLPVVARQRAPSGSQVAALAMGVAASADEVTGAKAQERLPLPRQGRLVAGVAGGVM